jgi:tetratricopeptide (TPR) repeat protein
VAAGDLRVAAVDAAMASLLGAGLGRSLDVVAVLVTIAQIAESSGSFAEAREAAERAVAMIGDVAGDPNTRDPDTWSLWCQAQRRVASLDRIAGDYQSAERRLLDVLELSLLRRDDETDAVVSTSYELGVVYKYAGRFDEAEAAYRQALAVLGADHPEVADDLNALGALYQLAGRFDDAARVYEQSLGIFEASYGADHFEVAMVCGNQAALASESGDHARAEQLGLRSLAILEATLGPDDVEVGVTLLNLAAAVAARGRTDDALELLTRAESILAARLLPGHSQYVAVNHALNALRGQP